MKLTRIAIIDVSASMDQPFSNELAPEVMSLVSQHNHKFSAALNHLRYVIQKMPSKSELIIISFAESAKEIYRGSVEKRDEINRCLAELSPVGSRTNLAGALSLVLNLLRDERHSIRFLDIVTDGLSNEGNPVKPANELRKNHGVYINLYLIDPTYEGKFIAQQIIGDEGEGEIDTVASAYELSLLQRKKDAYLAKMFNDMEIRYEKIGQERANFYDKISTQERPRITAAYPQVIPPGKWRTIELFIYLKNFKTLVESQIKKLKEYNEECVDATSQFSRSLPNGCPIKIMLSSDKLRFNPSEISILWLEPYNRLQFRVCTVEEISEATRASIDIEVFADDLLVASLPLSILVDANVGRELTNVTSEVQWYEKIFASYADEDFKIAKHLKERYAALGFFMFIDREDLGSGLWQYMLLREIESSDLFQLLWSNKAKNSTNVEAEWRHAILISGAKRHKFIRPIYWEKPIPNLPTGLKDINFRYISFTN